MWFIGNESSKSSLSMKNIESPIYFHNKSYCKWILLAHLVITQSILFFSVLPTAKNLFTATEVAPQFVSRTFQQTTTKKYENYDKLLFLFTTSTTTRAHCKKKKSRQQISFRYVYNNLILSKYIFCPIIKKKYCLKGCEMLFCQKEIKSYSSGKLHLFLKTL